MPMDFEVMEKSDEELVVLTLKEKDHYRYLMGRYEDRLKRYIKRITNISPDESDDILQGAFIKAYIKLNDFDSRFKFSSWIYRITRNETIDHLRRLRTRPVTHNGDDNDEAINNIRAELDIDGDIDKKYLKENFEKVINRLDEKYRDVIVLKYFEEKDYREISDILQKPMGTIAILLKRAKEQIRKEALKNKDLTS